MGKIKILMANEEILSCSYCEKLDRINEMNQIPNDTTGGIDYLCSQCAEKYWENYDKRTT